MRRAPIVSALAAVVAALIAVTHANAHGGARAQGYTSTFSGLQPNVLGVLVNVSGADNLVRLTNYSGKTVVVLGYHDEPYLRFTRSAVDENVASPSAFVNRSRPVPADAARATKPRWRRVARGASYTWHDHRIVWTGSQPPSAVEQEPDAAHLIFRWRIPAKADGKRFRITGFLGWSPSPNSPRQGTNPWLIAAAAVGGTIIVAGAIGVGVRRARRRTP